MKRLGFALLLMQSPLLFAANKPAPNPADYPLTIQVVQSRITSQPNGPIRDNLQILETVIDGKPVELQSFVNGLFPLGSYKARQVPSPAQPKHPTYDLFLRYELIMPDGTLRSYDVTGLGPDPTSSKNP